MGQDCGMQLQTMGSRIPGAPVVEQDIELSWEG